MHSKALHSQSPGFVRDDPKHIRQPEIQAADNCQGATIAGYARIFEGNVGTESEAKKSRGHRLRSLFRTSPSSRPPSKTPSPGSRSTTDRDCATRSHQSSRVQALPEVLDVVQDDAKITLSLDTLPGSETAKDGGSSRPARVDIWRLAYDDFVAANPDLASKCSAIFEPNRTNVPGTVDEQNAGEKQESQLGNPAALAFDKIEMLHTERSALHGRSAKFRRYFEETVQLIIRAKDAVALAAAANPYTATAFTAVSLLLPLFLTSTQENEAALEGLNFVATLIIEYQWKEKSYLSSDAAQDFTGVTAKLYLSILEYEAHLYDHMQHNKASRLAKNLYGAGGWLTRVEALKQLDSQCRRITDSIAEARAVEWRDEERKWQDQMRDQPKLEAEKVNSQHLYCRYETAKNINPERGAGTLEWFFKHPKFLGWRSVRSSRILWLTADPACGKSVLSKCLVDRRGELSSVSIQTPLICYFFFRAGDAELTDAAVAIKALLHQLFNQHPGLYRHAARDFDEKGTKFLSDFDTLWTIFVSVLQDQEVDEIICVLDALDECQASQDHRKKLVQNLTALQNKFAHSSCIRKFFVTSRPYLELDREFRALTMISDVHLAGEEENEKLRGEIYLVMSERLTRLAQKLQLSVKVREALYLHLSSVEHRTYLWLTLMFDFLECRDEISVRTIPQLLKDIPDTIEKAYIGLLDRVQNPARARRLLQYVLAATTPLTLSEVNVLMNIDEDCATIDDIELWPESIVESTIKSICGLFVTIIDSRVYLIHETAREFLIRDASKPMSSLAMETKASPWMDSFEPRDSALALLKACVAFLFLEFEDTLSTSRSWIGRRDHARAASADVTLLTYAARHWATQFKMAESLITPELSLKIATKLFDPDRVVFKLWVDEYSRYAKAEDYKPRRGPGLTWAAFLGLDSVVAHLTNDDADLNVVDQFGRTALAFASEKGHSQVVHLLLDRHAHVNVKDMLRQTPLMLSSRRQNTDITRMLLNAGADVTAIDAFGKTALSYGGPEALPVLSIPSAAPSDEVRHPDDGSKDVPMVPQDTPSTLKQMLDAIRKYIIHQHQVTRNWRSVAETTLLENAKSSKSTGLSTVYDNLVHAIEAFEAPVEQYEEARNFTFAAFGALETTVQTESPLLLTYLPRITAFLWSHNQRHLARTVAEELSSHALQLYGSEHALTVILLHLQALLLQQPPSLAMWPTISSIFDQLTSTWTSLLGPTHAHITYVLHVAHTIEPWFHDAATLTPRLASQSAAADAAHGPTSFFAIQLRLDLAQNLLLTSQLSAARDTSQEVCERIIDSLTKAAAPPPPSSSTLTPTPTPPPPTTAPVSSSSSSTSSLPLSPPPPQRNAQRSTSAQNLRSVHLFCEALRVTAEAETQLGLAQDAEASFRELLHTSERLLGPIHSRTKEHRRGFARFLRGLGREGEVEVLMVGR